MNIDSRANGANKNKESIMDAGLYSNLFEVYLEEQDAQLMQIERNRFPDLRGLRHEILQRGIDAQVYATGEDIYGYSGQQEQLAGFGFTTKTLKIHEIPPFASHLILEGYINSLREAEYTCQRDFGRVSVFQFKSPLLKTSVGVKLFRGFELESFFILNPETEDLTYVMVVNPAFTYLDPNDQPINPKNIVTKFGNETLRAIRVRQGDLAPRGGINLEVSRQRLVEIIMPFVAARHKFVLPCGIPAELGTEPIRIILSGPETRQ